MAYLFTVPKIYSKTDWRERSFTKPNYIHQADLLFLPHDTIGKKVYKNALTISDEASRFKEAERTKRIKLQRKSVARLKKITRGVR